MRAAAAIQSGGFSVVDEEIALSLVLPAYNEAARLPPFLESVRGYLETHYPDRHEVIVVDDGSQDELIDEP